MAAMKSVMCEKQVWRRKKKRTPWVSNPWMEILRELSEFIWTHRRPKGQERRRRRSTTRGFLRKCQPPAWQRFSGDVERHERQGAVSSQRDGKTREVKTVQSSTTCGSKRQWCLGRVQHIALSYAWQNDVKTSVYKAWQISPICRIASSRGLRARRNQAFLR